jgi:hypothetical protein
MRLLNSLGVGELATYLYPTLYDCSNPVVVEKAEMPPFPVIRLSVLRLLTTGLYIAGKLIK